MMKTNTKPARLKLVEKPQENLTGKKLYSLILGDKAIGRVYWNTSGWCPVVEVELEPRLRSGEMTLGEIRYEVTRYNRIAERNFKDNQKTPDTYYTHALNVDGCLRNGSFVVLRSNTEAGRRGKYAQYMNGDFMGHIDTIPEGMAEVAGGLALRLLPKCCGGKG